MKDLRTRFSLIWPIVGASLLVVAALFAQDKEQPQTSDGVPSTAEEVVTRTTEEREDSLFALIDENFKMVRPIFEKSCFDCHSNSPKYPWYHSLPLIKGMIDDDIKKGRKNVDFSSGFPFEGKQPILQILHNIREEIDEGDMPLWQYRLMHWGTKIEGVRKDSVFAWLDSSIAMIENFYSAEKIQYQKEEPKSDPKDAEKSDD
ncbi:MAG: heme-binding domain-containing protein [Candidatus Zixiibacteriota bacterium]